MKYKQRLVTVTIVASLTFALLTFYKISSFKINPDTLDPHEITGTCGSKAPYTTADFTVASIYDDLNFTLNPIDGLYKVIEKEHLPNEQHKRYTNPLQIVVVPHSHNDPGWLWTFDNYYYIRTKSILTNTVGFLQNHKDFRMIWTETVFLDKWWKESPESLRSSFKELVHGGQIEILSGGWVSVDEATTHYTAVLDQLIEGHLWIKEHLGVFPNTSWSIDPFGYSATLPYLWQKAGMKDMTILRIHGAVKEYMANRKILTFNWRQPWDENGRYDMTCHVEPYTLYNIECSCGPNTKICKRLDFSTYGNLEDNMMVQIGDEERSLSFNEYAELVVKQYKKKASLYRHNVILMPHGDDFRYIEDYDFQVNYDNMKRLMAYINGRKDFNVHMKFGSVGEYFKILHSEKRKSKSEDKSLSGDFFTYTDKDNEYWSGYFTTRPFDKRMIRELMELLRTTEIFTSLIYVYLSQNTNVVEDEWTKDWESIQLARRAHSLLQHHDGITGTSAAETVVDFELRIHQAIGALINSLQNSITKILSPGSHTNVPDFKMGRELISPSHQLQTSTIITSFDATSLVILNSYSKPRVEIVSVHVDTYDIEIYDSRNRIVPYQVGAVWMSYETISQHGFEISFEIKVPPMGFTVYKIKRRSLSVRGDTKFDRKIKNIFANIISLKGNIFSLKNQLFPIDKESKNSDTHLYLENEFLKLSFLKSNGALQKICDKNSHDCTDVQVDFFRYFGNNSNAYCFNAVDKEKDLLKEAKSVVVTKGKYKSQVKVHHKLFSHTVTIYNTKGLQGQNVHIENNATIHYPEDRDTELMMRFSTSVQNKNMQYFTDSNGFQMISRKTRRNLPIGANFYPTTSMVVLEDSSKRFTLHSAQPLGVSSLSTGSLEIMLDRIPMSFGKGLEESVIDNKPAISKFTIQLEKFSKRHISSDFKHHNLFSSVTSHDINDLLQHPVVQLYSLTTTKFKLKELSFLDQDNLPCDMAIANFRSMLTESGKFIGTGLTLHKRLTLCDIQTDMRNPQCSSNRKLNVDKLFIDLEVVKVRQMSLSHLYEKTRNTDMHPMDIESFHYIWKK